MNEAFEAKQKHREEHLKAILCGLFIRFWEETDAYSAAVKAFEAFRKRMTFGRPVQKAAWLHSLIIGKQNLVNDEDMRKINAEFWQQDEDYYNGQWIAEHQQAWDLFVSGAVEYYNSLKDAYFEHKEMEYLAGVSAIPEELSDFLCRQHTLAEISCDFISMETAYKYALIGYTYGIRAERERRRGNKKRVPVVRRPHLDQDGRRLREPQGMV